MLSIASLHCGKNFKRELTKIGAVDLLVCFWISLFLLKKSHPIIHRQRERLFANIFPADFDRYVRLSIRQIFKIVSISAHMYLHCPCITISLMIATLSTFTATTFKWISHLGLHQIHFHGGIGKYLGPIQNHIYLRLSPIFQTECIQSES